MVINAAGIWIDRVNGLGKPGAKRRITGTKGVHIAVRLPPECQDYCVVSLNRDNEQIYCVPWRGGLHYIGPTESLYDGDPDDIRPTEPEIEWLLEEFAHLVPGAGIRRQDVRYAWAGVRPLTHDPAMPKGNRSRRIHDQADDGMDGMLSITAGPIMSHRVAGRDLAAAVAGRIRPSAAPQPLSYAARALPDEPGSPAVLNQEPGISIAQLRHAARTEQPHDLVDLLFRRVGLGWGDSMAREGLPRQPTRWPTSWAGTRRGSPGKWPDIATISTACTCCARQAEGQPASAGRITSRTKLVGGRHCSGWS